nr:unnamed protein product [Spirometra erinaceieuropaei]
MEADPATVLEWIKCSECRDLQITALEQLCTEILFSDNVDEFMRRYSYAAIISATTQVFADELAPDYLLEANARTLTYCLEMADTNAIHTIKERDLRIMCTRLDAVDMMSEKSNEVGQQIVKMLELITNHIPASVYRAGGLTSVLRFVQLYSERIHADVLQAGMNLVKTLCSHCEPTDPSLDTWIEALSALLNHHEQRVIDNALQSLASIVNRFARAGRDPTPVATAELIDQLSHHLSIAGGAACGSARKSVPGFEQLDVNASFASFRGLGGLGDQGKTPDPGLSNPALIDALTSLLLTLCCNSAAATQRLLSPENHLASTLATILLYSEDSIVSSVFRLIEVLIYILGEGRAAETCEGLRSRHHSHNAPELLPRPLRMDQEDKSQLPAGDATQNQPSFSPLEREAAYRAAVEAIRKQDKETFDSLLSDRALDLHHLDNRGQTLLNWAASFGTPYMVEQLCLRGADVQAGARTSLDYAAGFGRVEVCELLLKHGANPNLYDVEGLRPIDRARLKRDDPSAMAVVKLLEAHSSQVPFAGRTPSLSPHTSEWRSGKTTPVSPSPFLPETLFLFAAEILPVLITLFAKTQSEVVKYQTVLLVRRLVGYLNACDMQTLSDSTQDGLRLGFRLSQMIYTALAEEPEESVLCVLQLTQQLLHKARSVYLPIFQRIGLVAMIRCVYEVLKNRIELKSSRAKCASAGNTKAQPTDETTGGEGKSGQEEGGEAATEGTGEEEEQEAADEETEDHIEHSELLHFNEDNQEESEARSGSPAQEEDGEETHENSNEDVRASDQQVDEVAKSEEPNASGDGGERGEQNSPTPKQPVESEPVILSSAQHYRWQEWTLRWFGNLLFVFNSHAVVQLEINCPDGELRGIAMTAENGLVPIELRPGIEPLARSNLRADLLRLYHRIQGNGYASELFCCDQVPYFDTYDYEHQVAEHEKLQRSFSVPWLVARIGSTRGAAIDSSTRPRPPPPVPSQFADQSSSGKPTQVAFRRYLSSPSEATERSPLLAAFVRRLQPGLLQKPFPSHAKVGSLRLDVVKGDDGMHYLRVVSLPAITEDASSRTDPEMLLFSAYGRNGFLRLSLHSSNLAERKSRRQTPLVREHQVHYGPDFLRSLLATEGIRSTTPQDFRRPASEKLGPKKVADSDIPLIDESHNISATDSSKAEEIAFPRQPVLVDDKEWEITFHSGKLKQRIPQKSLDGGNGQTTAQESSTLIRFQIHHLAWKLLCRELVSTPTTPSATAPQTPANLQPTSDRSCELQLQQQQQPSYDRLCVLRDFATQIVRLTSSGDDCIESVSSRLEDIFRRISAILSEGGEEALTAYEVITSGLSSALLLCLSPARILSWASAIASKPEQSQDPSMHVRFLQARRLAFCRAFMPSLGGTGITSLVRRLVEALDQTQRLPLNLFERIQTVRHTPSRKIKTKPAKPNGATAVDGQLKETAGGAVSGQKQPAPITTIPPSSIGQELPGQTRDFCPLPVSCPPSTGGGGSGGVFTFRLVEPTDDPATPMSSLPLGLLCPRSEMWEMAHRSLNGGGVRALLDRQVNLVLGEFVPSSAYSMCTGRLGMMQLQQGCPLLMERAEVGIECEAPGGKLHLARMANHTIFVTTLTSVGRLRSRMKELTAKYWYQLPRTEMAFFRMFRDKPDTRVLLAPPTKIGTKDPIESKVQNATTSSPGESAPVMGVIDWLGTNAGDVPINDWVHPLNLGLIQAVVIPSNVPVLGTVTDAFAPRLSRSGSKPGRDNAVGLLVGSTLEVWQEHEAGKKTEEDRRPGIVVDLGVQLIPSAYSLAPLRGNFRELTEPVAPRNWCLQASNNGQDWVTLRTHVNDTLLNPEVGTVCTWTLDPCSATPSLPQKSQPIGKDVLAESAPSEHTTSKEKAAQEHKTVLEEREGVDATVISRGWRVYRLMATGPNSLGTCVFPIGALELYGRIVGVHDELLPPSDISGQRRHVQAHHKTADSGDTTRASLSIDPTNSRCADTITAVDSGQSDDPIRQLPPSWWRRLISIGAGVNASHLESLALSLDRFGLAANSEKGRRDESDDDDDDDEEDAFNLRPLAAARDALRLPLSELLDLIVRDPRLPRRLRDSIGTTRKSASVDLLQPLSPSLGTRERAATVDIPDLSFNLRRRRRRLGEDAEPSQYNSALDRLRQDSPASVRTNHLARDSDSICRLSHATEFISYSDTDDAFLETDGAALEFAEAVDALVQMNTDSPCTVTTVDVGDGPANQTQKILSTTLSTIANTSQEEGLVQAPQLASDAGDNDDEEEEEAVTLEDVFANLSDEDKTVDDSDALLAANSDIQAGGDNDTDNDESAEHIFAGSTTVPADVAATDGEETADGLGAHANDDGPSDEAGHDHLRRAFPEAESDTILPETVRSRDPNSSPEDVGVTAVDRRAPRNTEAMQEQSGRRTTTGVIDSRDNCSNEHNNLALGLIPAFDPNPRNRNASASSEFILSHPPGSSSPPDAYAVKLTQQDKTQLVITLKAYLRDGSLVASVRAEDNNRPIFSYFFQLAERIVYSSVLTNSPLLDSIIEAGEEGATERLTVKVNYCFRTPEDDKADETEEVKVTGAATNDCDDTGDRISTAFLADSPRMLTDRDIRLAKFQDQCIRLTCQGKLPGELTYSSSANITASEPTASLTGTTTTSKVEQLLELIRIIYQISGTQNRPLSDLGNAAQPVRAAFCTPDDEVDTEQQTRAYDFLATSGLNNDLAPEHFISYAISRKLIRQLMDPLSVVSSTLPDWCFNLPRRLSVLFPYEVRLNLLTSSAFGVARSVIWLQNHVARSTDLTTNVQRSHNRHHNGFERVFRMDWLALFSPRELGQLICGDSDLNWTREELLAYTVPCFGFTQNSITFQLFISVLVDFNLEQRRAFLRFVTGCSSLPPGGLRNLSPRLRVVRKDAQQGPFPSVNTCAHYLKLPEYNSQSELCHYLLAATKESGFYLN